MQRAGHRVDIDGLRCVAVVLVVLFHAGVPWLAGGFVGVDVFFVISGFLITGLLLDEHTRSGRISLSGFWARRVRRIVPALIVVVLAVLLAGRWILLPWEFDSLLHSVRATVLSIANVHFWQASGDYFSSGVERDPLLHMWSLGVEEQFYLALPLVVVGALRVGRTRALGTMIGLLGAGSFVWSVMVVGTAPQTAFYLPQFRAWELLLGSGLALARPQLRRIPDVLARMLVRAGLAAIVISALAYSASTAFPGAAALLPTIGTAAVIAAGAADRPPTIAGRLLASGPAQWIGAWSYSWYLWHWAALVLVRHRFRTESLWRDLLVCVASLGVAAVSWRLVEERFRRVGTSTARARAGVLLVGVGALVATAVTVTPLLPAPTTVALPMPTTATVGTAPSSIDATTATEPATQPTVSWPADVDWADPARLGALEASRANPQVPCTGIEMVVPFDPACELLPGERYLVLVGDSHAAHLAAPLLQVAAEQGLGMVVASLAACPLLPGVIVSNETGVLDACTEWSISVLADLEAHADRIAVVVGSARGAWYGPGDGFTDRSIWETQIVGADTPERSGDLWGAGLVGFADLLASRSIPFVWVHGVPEFREEPSSCLPFRSVAECSTPRTVAADYRRPAFEPEAEALRDRDGVATVDPFEVLCSDDLCRPVRGESILYRDGDHLTIEGADLLRPAMTAAVRGLLDT